MIAKLLLKPFGSFWSLKKQCQEGNGGLMHKIRVAIYKMYLYENAADIAISSHFANEPCMPHGERGVFVAGAAKIGRNAIIFQQVTIGSVSLPDSNGLGAPTIGDNCYIGAGAKVVGNVTIGDNVRIGANAVVYQDVPDNSVVVSGAQKTITKKEPLINRYYTYNDDTASWSYFEDGRWVKVEDPSLISILSQGEQ
jgi:serine O-acetyltransferase